MGRSGKRLDRIGIRLENQVGMGQEEKARPSGSIQKRQAVAGDSCRGVTDNKVLSSIGHIRHLEV